MKNFLTFAILLWACAADAAYSPQMTAVPGSVPSGVNYQGRLEEGGLPVTGSKSMTFRVFDAAGGGNQLWTSGAQSVSVTLGLFNSVLPIPVDALVGGGGRWLEVTVEGTVLTPREPLNSVPYAMVAKTVEGAIEVSSGGLSILPAANGVPALSIASGTSVSVGIATANASALFTVGAGSIVVTRDGDVGLGTSLPQARLSVHDANASVSVGAMGFVELVNEDTTANNTYGLHFRQLDTAGNLNTVATLDAVGASHAVGAQSGGFIFGTRNAGVFGEKMRIDPQGYLGVGQPVPSERLHVAGALRLENFGGDGAVADIRQQHDGAANTADRVMYFVNGTGITTGGWAFRETDGGDLTPSTVMKIETQGRVGIGETTLTRKLHVRSTTGANTILQNDGTGNAVLEIQSMQNKQRAINFLDSTGSAMSQIGVWGNAGVSSMTFNTSGLRRMTIETNGDIGVGTDNPGTKLNISSGILTVDGTGARANVIGTVDARVYGASELTNVYGQVFQTGTLVPGGTTGAVNLNGMARPSGNLGFFICAINRDDGTYGDMEYAIGAHAHGATYNNYTTLLTNVGGADGFDLVVGASDCTFTNNNGAITARWIIKSLPLSVFDALHTGQ